MTLDEKLLYRAREILAAHHGQLSEIERRFYDKLSLRVDQLGSLKLFHYGVLSTIEALMEKSPAEGTPEFNLLVSLAAAAEGYEKATLPPPFGDAKP